jgi:hypothetical protein
MRKSLWILPVLLLFAALLGSTAARADTFVFSGGFVSGINGITVAGVTYNVTWGLTDDTTFASSLANALAMNAQITADLAGYQPPPPPATLAGQGTTSLFDVGVDGGTLTPYADDRFTPTFWSSHVDTTSDYILSVQEIPAGIQWDEFTVVSPEPGAATLTLTGLGMFGLLVVMRKRLA